MIKRITLMAKIMYFVRCDYCGNTENWREIAYFSTENIIKSCKVEHYT